MDTITLLCTLWGHPRSQGTALNCLQPVHISPGVTGAVHSPPVAPRKRPEAPEVAVKSHLSPAQPCRATHQGKGVDFTGLWGLWWCRESPSKPRSTCTAPGISCLNKPK